MNSSRIKFEKSHQYMFTDKLFGPCYFQKYKIEQWIFSREALFYFVGRYFDIANSRYVKCKTRT